MEATDKLLLLSFLIALPLGALSNKCNFCTMGAISDWINLGQRGRLWAWFLAIAIAMAAATGMEAAGIASLDATLPPYRTANFAWLRYVLGGLLFGIGMTLGGGCANKTLINIGNGSGKSLLVAAIVAVMAYLMTKTDFYELVFHPWISATTINLASHDIADQSLPALLAPVFGSATGVRMAIGFGLAALIVVLALRSRDFRSNRNNLVGGLTVGLAVSAGWYLSGGPLGKEAIEAVEWMDARPLGVAVQSYTFVNPLGETLNYLMSPGNVLLLTFGIAALGGVALGSFLYAVFSRRFRLTGFVSWADFFKHVVAGILMGIGGVLAMGCTIGQGVTGVSTLALGSFLVLASIIFGSALTMKIQYYQMIYEEEATFAAALLSSLADMRLLPETARRLERP